MKRDQRMEEGLVEPTPKACWADEMSNDGDDPPHDESHQEDMCDQLLRHFPVPGEIWVHLRTQCNYLSSLLAMYTCPQEGEVPHIINGWRSMHKLSPYRVTYGTHNPAMHGLILTHNTIIPNQAVLF